MIIAFLVFVVITVEMLYCLQSPYVNLLPPFRNGVWMRAEAPVDLYEHYEVTTNTIFRKQFVTESVPRDHSLEVAAFRNIRAIMLDGTMLPFNAPSTWKQQTRVTLPAQALEPGVHEIVFVISNSMAPPLLHVTSNVPGLDGIAGWQTSNIEGIVWKSALSAAEQRSPLIKYQFPTVIDGLKNKWWFVIPLLIVTMMFAIRVPLYAKHFITPPVIKYLLMGVLVVLGINNMLKYTVGDFGFDAPQHLDYISYILKNHSLPLASEGWQMFQPPLYYMLSALLFSSVGWVVPSHYLSVIPGLFALLCLLSLVEISDRTLRELVPGRDNLHCCGLFIAALLPLNIYMCQTVGNEPLSAVFVAVLVFLTVKYCDSTKRTLRIKNIIILGAVAGAAILTKMTALPLIPLICLYVVIPGFKHNSSHGNVSPHQNCSRYKAVFIFLLTICVVSGWYFTRNLIYQGKPFIGGWDPSRGIVWWQEPGYRILSDYIAFGECLYQPIYSAFNGFADSLYSTFWSDGYLSGVVLFSRQPPWNYDYLVCGVIFSVVPAFAMLAGFFIAFWRSNKSDSRPCTFLFLATGIYLVALVHLYSVLPIYSTVKASYTMGLTPCYAVMTALGADVFMKNRYIQPLFISLIVVWGTVTYMGFFVV